MATTLENFESEKVKWGFENSERNEVREQHLRVFKEVSKLFETNSVPWWVMGGYAVEAITERNEPLREHRDIDICCMKDDFEKIKQVLLGANYTFIQEKEYMYKVLLDGKHHVIDLYLFNADPKKNFYLPTEKEVGRNLTFPGQAFRGEWKQFNDTPVRPLLPELLYILLTRGPKIREDHLQDIKELEKIINPQKVEEFAKYKTYISKEELQKFDALKSIN